jgi:hypothetical protein
MRKLILEWIFCLFKKFLQERAKAQLFHEKNLKPGLGLEPVRAKIRDYIW